MTLPTAKAGGFSGWCKACLKALPEPVNIQGRIAVAGDGEPAMRAGVHTDRQVFGNPGPTLGAELGGIPGWDFNYLTTSLFRFEAKYVEELKPSHIPHGSVERSEADPRAHLLYVEGAVVSQETIGHLEVEVPPLIADLLVGPGHQYSSLGSAFRAFRPVGESPLPHSQDSLGPFEEAGVIYGLAFRGGQEGFAADINADCLFCWGQGLFRHVITGEGGEPSARSTAPDGDSFDVSLYGPGEPKLESAHLPDGQVFVFQLPTGLRQGERVIPILALEAGEASLAIAIPGSAKEPFVGPVQPFQDILEDLGTNLFVFGESSPELGKLFLLAEIGDVAPILTVDVYALFQRSIVEPAAEVKPEGGFAKGFLVRLKAIEEGLFHLPCTAFTLSQAWQEDKSCRASPSVSPALKCGGLDDGIC